MDQTSAMKVFAKVIKDGGFTKAVRAPDIAPPVVTRMVAELENHLDERLPNRTGLRRDDLRAPQRTRSAASSRAVWRTPRSWSAPRPKTLNAAAGRCIRATRCNRKRWCRRSRRCNKISSSFQGRRARPVGPAWRLQPEAKHSACRERGVQRWPTPHRHPLRRRAGGPRHRRAAFVGRHAGAALTAGAHACLHRFPAAGLR